MIVYFLGGGAGGLPLLWSPKTITLLWFSGVCEGHPCPDCLLLFFHFFLARFNQEFAVSGLGMVFKFLRYTIFSLLLKEIQSLGRGGVFVGFS